MTVAETFEVVHGLVNNMTVVMKGTQGLLCLDNDLQLRYHSDRWKSVNRWHPKGSWYDFNVFLN